MMGGGGDGGPSGEGGPCGKCNKDKNSNEDDIRRDRRDEDVLPAPVAPGAPVAPSETLDLGATLGGGLDSFSEISGARNVPPIDPSVLNGALSNDEAPIARPLNQSSGSSPNLNLIHK